MCFDADLNIHLPELLGIDFSENKHLSKDQNTKKIREYLIGISRKIQSIDHFYSTTPPSIGVNLFEITSDNKIINEFAQAYGTGYIAVVGKCEVSEIGRSCYHTNLTVFENLLSFAKLSEDDWVVADMVAGVDAFSNTLHMQFDTLFLLVEPTRESVAVYEQYIQLAKHAGVLDRLFAIGNRVENKEDESFIASRVRSDKYIGFIRKSSQLKKLRQQGKPLTSFTADPLNTKLFERMAEISRSQEVNPNDRLKHLHKLHLKYITQDWVMNAVGDISGQIDEEFKF